MKADRDPEQQRMISAILTMAERMNLETLAEGVENGLVSTPCWRSWVVITYKGSALAKPHAVP